MTVTIEDTEYGLARAALQQTATELMRLYDDCRCANVFEPMDVDALAAWRRISGGMDTLSDLDLIRSRGAFVPGVA
jgi:hypothetical protein